MLPAEQALLSLFREKKLPHLLAYNKADLTENRPALPENALYVSALTGENVDALKNLLGTLAGKTKAIKKSLPTCFLRETEWCWSFPWTLRRRKGG